MRIIHSGGFPDDERRQNRAVIYSNIIIAFKILLDIMDTEQIPFENEKTKVRNIQEISKTMDLLQGSLGN
jgi:guanine nucleotide-binding protein subunit alpha